MAVNLSKTYIYKDINYFHLLHPLNTFNRNYLHKVYLSVIIVKWKNRDTGVSVGK